MRNPLRKKSPIEQQADMAYKRATGPSPRVFVLPFGWCVHVFAPGERHDTFLVACSETKIFHGIDRCIRGWRVIALRVNHIPHNELVKIVEQAGL